MQETGSEFEKCSTAVSPLLSPGTKRKYLGKKKLGRKLTAVSFVICCFGCNIFSRYLQSQDISNSTLVKWPVKLMRMVSFITQFICLSYCIQVIFV